ncbi:RsmE family RNA methyltransferase [Pseudoroseomonas wenyumeiae]
MSIPRLYVEADLAEGVDVPALPGQGHYLGQVMRKGKGFRSPLQRPARRMARPHRRHPQGPRHPGAGGATAPPGRHARYPAAAGPLKRDAMEWVVEKATELGVASIHPVLTTRGVVGRINHERLSTIAREAAEQCERLDLPAIAPAQDLHAALDAWDGTPLFLGHERGKAPSLASLLPGRVPRSGFWSVPRGFTKPELDAMGRRHFVSSAALGPRILRAETAAVAGLAVLQALAGDWTVPS